MKYDKFLFTTQLLTDLLSQVSQINNFNFRNLYACITYGLGNYYHNN